MAANESSGPRFQNGDGHNIFCRSWTPRDEPRALVFLTHGFCDHCSEPGYLLLAESLVPLGCYVFTHDHVGHGKSEGPRGNIRSADTYVDDMLTHIDMARAMFTGKPVFLFGHSMGGLLVVMAAQRRPNDFSGMALLAPLLGVSKHHAGWLTKTAVRLLGCLCPGLPVGSTPPYDLCCRDPAVVQRMANDPLQYRGSVYAGWGAAMMSALNTTLANTSAVQLPFFIQHGTDDKMCDLEYSKEFFKKAPSKDKSIKVYMGAYHSPLNEPEGVGEEVLKDLVAWFDARLPPSKSLILSPHDNDEGTDTTAKIFDSTV